MDILTRRIASIAYARRHRGRGQAGHTRPKRVVTALPAAPAATMAAGPPDADFAERPVPDIDAMTKDELREALEKLGLNPHHRSGRAKLAGELREALADHDLGS